MSDKQYPTYQYSEFLGDKQQKQIVIRHDDWGEFKLAKANIDKILERQHAKEEDGAPTTICSTCGQPGQFKKGISKKGKPYSAIFCSTENKSHTQWL